MIAVDEAVSIASGFPFLGVKEVRRCANVVYFSGEGGPSVLQDYARRVATSKGVLLADLLNLHWCFTLPQLADLQDLDALRQRFLDTAAEVAFFDPVFLCMPSEEAGNVLRQGKVLNNVNRICVDSGVTPIFVHHFKRTRTVDQYAPGDLIDLTQAGFAEFAGQWQLLTRSEPYNADMPGEHKLWLNIGGRAGHSSLHALEVHEGSHKDLGGRRWQVAVLRPDEVQQKTADRKETVKQEQRQQSVDQNKKRLVNALAKYPEGETASAVRTRAALSGACFNTALAELLDEGAVVEIKISKANRKQPYTGYKLAE